nr:MAG TPA: hypothetical protein [Crassvirales sp.]
MRSQDRKIFMIVLMKDFIKIQKHRLKKLKDDTDYIN